jgi:hypothetical protein
MNASMLCARYKQHCSLNTDTMISHTVLNFQGEGVCDFSKVLVIKTHWPERRGWQRYHAKRYYTIGIQQSEYHYLCNHNI